MTTKTTSIMGTLMTRLNALIVSSKTFSLQERQDLTAHRDAWLAKRSPLLEKKTKFYSY